MAYMGTFAQCVNLALMRSQEDDNGYILLWRVKDAGAWYAQRIKSVSQEGLIGLIGETDCLISMPVAEFRDLCRVARMDFIERMFRND